MIGIDIVHIPRFRRVLEGRYGVAVAQNIFSEYELSFFPRPFSAKAIRSLAGRFAAKEAAIKAAKGSLRLADIKRIVIDANGTAAIISGIDSKERGRAFSISISHDGDYAVACAIKN